jgi:hypothetical protein
MSDYPTRPPKVAWRPGERRWARKRLSRGWEYYCYLPSNSSYIYFMNPRTGVLMYASHHIDELPNLRHRRFVELHHEDLRVNDGL